MVDELAGGVVVVVDFDASVEAGGVGAGAGAGADVAGVVVVVVVVEDVVFGVLLCWPHAASANASAAEAAMINDLFMSTPGSG